MWELHVQTGLASLLQPFLGSMFNLCKNTSVLGGTVLKLRKLVVGRVIQVLLR